jgi:hypothetical protein
MGAQLIALATSSSPTLAPYKRIVVIPANRTLQFHPRTTFARSQSAAIGAGLVTPAGKPAWARVAGAG